MKPFFYTPDEVEAIVTVLEAFNPWNLSRRIPDMSASAKRRSWGGRTRDIPAEP